MPNLPSTFTRSTVSERSYKRALKYYSKPWAQTIITKYLSEQQSIAKVEGYQKENLKEETHAEKVFASLLRSLNIRYKKEQVVRCRNGRNYILDFYVHKPRRVGFEIDGHVHDARENYDTERDVSIMSDYKLVIVRFTNQQVFFEKDYVKNLVLGSLGLTC